MTIIIRLCTSLVIVPSLDSELVLLSIGVWVDADFMVPASGRRPTSESGADVDVVRFEVVCVVVGGCCLPVYL